MLKETAIAIAKSNVRCIQYICRYVHVGFVDQYNVATMFSHLYIKTVHCQGILVVELPLPKSFETYVIFLSVLLLNFWATQQGNIA